MKLVVITAPGDGHGRGHEDIAGSALGAGCRAIQIRDKEMPDRELAELARRIGAECGRAGALLFMNDRVDVAAAVGCDGVHLGVSDLEVGDTRGILGPEAIIGYSPEGMEDAGAAVKAGADYLGIGSVYATLSKDDAGEPIGLEGLSSYCREVPVPVIAVGGITAENAAEALAAGAAGVAVMSAVASAPDAAEAAGKILEKIS
jgi:thiamine-phosphate diphosphorylase